MTEGLKMLPEAAGPRQHFQARGHSFSLYGPTLDRQITCLTFFPAVNWFYRSHKWVCLRNFVTESACAPWPLLTICKKSSQRASNSHTRQRDIYRLLTEFEVRTVSYGPSFFPFDLWPALFALGGNNEDP